MKETVTQTPEVRPTPEDAWVLLIVEMRRNNLPAPKAVHVNVEQFSVEMSSGVKVAIWAKHLGTEMSVRPSVVDGDTCSVARLYGWHGWQLHVYAYEPLIAPMSDETATLVDELAASVTS